MNSATKYLLTFTLYLFQISNIFSQCNEIPTGEQLQVINPSFEGPRDAHITPAPWSTCGITPDTQPGSWGITLPPSEGNSYVGFVNGGPAWLEGASQALSGNMIAGVEYTFTIDLASTNANQGGIIPAPTFLEIFGSHNICNKQEFLWSSPVISHTNWQTYTVTFTPTQNYSNIYFAIGTTSPYMSYILLDNITPIVPNIPTIEITSHTNGEPDGCAFIISGEISLPLADSIVLTGPFIESPIRANVSGVNWNQTINFTSTGLQTIYVRIHYVDVATGVNACSNDSVSVQVSSPIIGYETVDHCFNTTTTFNDTSFVLGVGSIVSWEWDFGDGNISTSQHPNHLYSNPGTYTTALTVKDQNDCSTSLTKQIIVHELPVANFTYTNACDLDDVTFSSTSSVSSGTIDQYSWDVQNDGIVDYITSNGNHTYPADGSYDIQLIVESNNGCSDTITQTITVYPLPIADFNFTNACDNQNVILSSTSTVSSGAISQHLWDVENDGVIDYTASNISHIFPSAGNHTVSLIAISENNCRDTISQTITIFPLPAADFNFTNACDQDEVTFSDTSTISSGTIIQTLWDIENNGSIDYTTNNGTHTFQNDGVHNITLIAISNNNCRDTITKPVTVYPLPAANFTFSNACNQEDVTFNSTSTVSSGTIDQYFWDVQNDGVIDFTSSVGNHTYPSDGNYDIQHIVETNFGCRDTIVQTITVFPLPIANYSFINACDNESLTFNSLASITSGTIVQTFWDVQNDGSIEYNSTNGNHTYPSHGRYDLTQIVVSNNGCYDTITQEVIVYPLPLANWNTTPVCEGISTIYNNTSTITNVDNDMITSWNWTFGDGTTSTLQNPTHTFNNENVYTTQLIATSNYGCKDTFINSATVWPLPVVNFSPTDVCLEFLTDFQDLSTISNTYTSNSINQWEWSFGDLTGVTMNNQNPSYAYLNDGNYNAKLIVTSNHGCKDSATLIVTVHPKPVASFTGVNLSGCAPICPLLSSTSTINNPSSIMQYIWKLSNGTTHSSNSIDYRVCLDNVTTSTRNYDVQLTTISNQGCTDSILINNFISVYHNPIASFNFDPYELSTYNEVAKMTNNSIGGQTYIWNFGDKSPGSTEINPTHAFPHDKGDAYIITLITISSEGCIDSTSAPINVKDEEIFYIPNTFTPDGDMFNQTFNPIFTTGYDPYDYQLLIFNRWGETIYESKNDEIGWDGTYAANGRLCQDGTYTWRIEFKTRRTDERKVYSGHVNLLR